MGGRFGDKCMSHSSRADERRLSINAFDVLAGSEIVMPNKHEEKSERFFFQFETSFLIDGC